MIMTIKSFKDLNDCTKRLSNYVMTHQGQTLEISIGEIEKDKTLKQLGGLFGNWIKFLSKELNESSKDLHAQLKKDFLLPIYYRDVVTNKVYGKHKQVQEMFIEHILDLKDARQFEKYNKHKSRISLSWINLSQMKEYMDNINKHYMSAGIGLPDMQTKEFKEHLRRLE